MVKISDIIALVKPHRFSGNQSAVATKVVELQVLNSFVDALSWCNEKNLPMLQNICAGTVICPHLPKEFDKNGAVNYIEVDKPRQVFQQVLKNYFAVDVVPAGISPSAKIDAGVKIGQEVRIGHNVVIEKGSVIGDCVTISHNTVIFKNTVIGNHVTIGANCSIGGAGFGYEKNEDGQYEMLPHIGNVVIHDRVEIAHNVCIDRAVLSSTVIKKNAKIDNLVHIAHNVEIGENSLIIANSMIGGSTIIGDNVWVAPSASIINKSSVGDHALVGMGAVVIKRVEANQVVAGNPARKLEK